MSSRLSFTGNRFKTIYQKENGPSFYGQILDIPDTSRVSNFLSARRYLRVSPRSTIRPNDIIIAANKKYIVANHADGFHHGLIYIHYKLFEVDAELTWKKKSFTKNAVTGIEEMTLTEQLETVYISLQPKNDVIDSIKIPQETFIALSNVEVSRDDIIGNYVVLKSDKQLGISVLELKEI